MSMIFYKFAPLNANKLKSDIMKHFFSSLALPFILGVVALSMSSCVDTPTARVMIQDPIYPLHMTGDRQEVFWTDYVPLFVAEGMLPEKGEVEAKGEISNIRFMEHRACVDIVVLPNKPVAHRLVSAGVSDGKVYIRLLEPGE